MSRKIGHQNIRAFAGSGKTHALVNRYIRLLSLGVEPSRINALTFTRKAAGEFLQKIFLRLTNAAESEDEAASLSSQIERTDLKSADFQNLLMALVKEMGSLQLGTIDSFFARLIGAFPYELGLTRPHRIMDEFEHGVARQTAMERLLSAGNEDRVIELLHLYKNLTWGTEDKNVYSQFEKRLKDHQALFLEDRDAALWGQGASIFVERPWWQGSFGNRDKLVDRILLHVENLDVDKRFLKALTKIVHEFSTWQPGQAIEGGTLFDRLLEVREDLRAGVATVVFSSKKIVIEPPLSSDLYTLLQIWISGEIARRLVITESLGEILDAYDIEYNHLIREGGSLVFADLPVLLIKGLCRVNPAFATSEILYRLDSQSDHWLVDEFQDTSRIQWKVLSSFIDEIIQDSSGQRTFFYVGDVKQSIYAWRGGDPRLFNEILDHYNASADVIPSIPLEFSWRSAPEVLDCVNALFGPGITAPLVPAAVAKRWQSDWLLHKPSPLTCDLQGYAGWGIVESDATLDAACIETIKSIDPLNRGLSCAILVRKNDEVLRLTQSLREAEIPASMEGVTFINRDNIVGRWILAFLYALARPNESFPRAYLSFAGIEMDDSEFNRLAGLIRSVLTNDGYAEVVRRLIDYLEKRISFNRFLRHRSMQILESATRFESTSMDGLESFIDYMEKATVAEASIERQVQVMTVHKSKGLDFDVVLVAGFGPSPMIKASGQPLHVERDESGGIQWIMELPNKQIYEQDPVLAKAHRSEEETFLYESLCLLYVAMTRAKQGLYCIAADQTRNSSKTTWHQLLRSAFSNTSDTRIDGSIEWQAEWGQADWYKGHSPSEDSIATHSKLEPATNVNELCRPVFKRMASPSQESHATTGTNANLRSTKGRRFGTRMHDFLSTVEWIDDKTKEDAIGRADPDLRERFLQLIESDLGKDVFTRPERPSELWIEKPYVLRRGDAIAHGIIDRAVVHLDASGNPVSVIIYDYKTDVLDPNKPVQEQLMEKYSTQLDRYREAVASLTGIPEDSIQTILVPV
jgi:ATP-dependent exoDNAse (exonuclease V) beta subunit